MNWFIVAYFIILLVDYQDSPYFSLHRLVEKLNSLTYAQFPPNMVVFPIGISFVNIYNDLGNSNSSNYIPVTTVKNPAPDNEIEVVLKWLAAISQNSFSHYFGSIGIEIRLF